MLVIPVHECLRRDVRALVYSVFACLFRDCGVSAPSAETADSRVKLQTTRIWAQALRGAPAVSLRCKADNVLCRTCIAGPTKPASTCRQLLRRAF